jgi:hypothetical protein
VDRLNTTLILLGLRVFLKGSSAAGSARFSLSLSIFLHYLISISNYPSPQGARKFACYMWEGYRRHTGPELHTGGMRGSKPAGFSSTGE